MNNLLLRGVVTSPMALAVTGALSVATGALVVVQPAAAGMLTLAVVSVWLLTLGERLVPFMLAATTVVLVGYAFLGRGFAYAGIPPLFIGDAVLGFAVLTVMVSAKNLRPTVLHWPLFLFIVLGAARTFPYLQRDGINALRDGTLWGYAFYALALATVIEREHFGALVRIFRRLAPYFVITAPIAGLLTLTMYGALPKWPVSGAPMIHFKGEAGIHLAAVAAFVLVGLYDRRRSIPSSHELLLWAGWFLGVGFVATQNRGGMLAATAGVSVALFLRASAVRRLPFFAVLLALLTIVLAVNPTVDTGQVDKISLEQVRLNAVSVVSDTGEQREGNKQFRLDWWKTIVDYTIYGEYFWTGKGFGVNLADDDGFRVDDAGTLRAPHNTHMTVLARMGVPGLVLWIVFQLGFAAALIMAFRRSWKAGAVFWAQINALLLVYWVAMNVNTTFDPYLEGPQGGIWFWCVVGLGLAAIRIQRESLEEPAERAPVPAPGAAR